MPCWRREDRSGQDQVLAAGRSRSWLDVAVNLRSAMGGQSAQAYYAGSRIAVGVAIYAAPRVTGRLWVGPDGTRAPVSVITRAFAIRDVAIGVGTLRATRNGRSLNAWLQTAAVADLGDLVSALLLPRSTRRLLLIAFSAAGVSGDMLALLAAHNSSGQLAPSTP